MIFATATTPAAAQLRRQAYAQAGRSAEKFLSDALFAVQRQGCTTSQDGNTVFKTAYDHTVMVMPSTKHGQPGNTMVRLGRFEA